MELLNTGYREDVSRDKTQVMYNGLGIHMNSGSLHSNSEKLEGMGHCLGNGFHAELAHPTSTSTKHRGEGKLSEMCKSQKSGSHVPSLKKPTENPLYPNEEAHQKPRKWSPGHPGLRDSNPDDR